MNSKTAILVFANSAKEELLRKPIVGGHQLFNELNKTVVSIVKKTNLPYYVFTEEHQYGTSFGERFAHAIQHVFNQGFENIITIGNDTPFLTKKHLTDTATLLEKNKCVLGPSADGGFYLMGLNKSQFDTATFLKLPWKSKQLTQSISCLLDNTGIEVVTLQVLYDIDTINDIKFIQAFSHKLSDALVQIIQVLLEYSYTSKTSNSIQYTSTYASFSYNKGSPLFGILISKT